MCTGHLVSLFKLMHFFFFLEIVTQLQVIIFLLQLGINLTLSCFQSLATLLYWCRPINEGLKEENSYDWLLAMNTDQQNKTLYSVSVLSTQGVTD